MGSLKTVTWDEPGCFDAILVKHLEDSLNTKSTSKVAYPG